MLLRFQFKAWFGTLQFSILITCPRHLSLLSLVISSSLAIHVFFLTSTLLTFSLYSKQSSLKLMACCFQCLYMYQQYKIFPSDIISYGYRILFPFPALSATICRRKKLFYVHLNMVLSFTKFYRILKTC